MAGKRDEFQRRLHRIRRGYKIAVAIQGLLLLVTEALGLFLLMLLVDWIYDLPGAGRVVLLAAGGAVLLGLFVWHVVAPLLRRIDEKQVALLVEERAPDAAAGSVISALEFGREHNGGLRGYVARFLLDDAVGRLDRSRQGLLAHLRRLKKHAVAALALLVVFAATTSTKPVRTRSARIINPWVSIARERAEAARAAREAEARRLAEEERRRILYGPMTFAVRPGDTAVVRGTHVPAQVALSREPADTPQLYFRTAGTDWQSLPMSAQDALYAYARTLTDLNEDIHYYIASSHQRSKEYTIKVYDKLAIKGIEITYHYPEYLHHEPVTVFETSGDIEVVAGTKVDLRVVANNKLTSGKLTFDGKKVLPLKPGSKAADGATASFTVGQDTTYTITVTDEYKQTFTTEDFYYVKALPDKPPPSRWPRPRWT